MIEQLLQALFVFGSTFIAVFFLGLQSLNVNQGDKQAAGVTSFFISSGHILLYRYMPAPSGLEIVGYYLGGIVGIVKSIEWHPYIKAWITARRGR
jgi:hypothetical protein